MQDLCHPLHILHNIAAYIRSYAQKIFFIDSNDKQKKRIPLYLYAINCTPCTLLHAVICKIVFFQFIIQRTQGNI